MSTALAIASVTAVLKDLLNNGLIDHRPPVGDVTVSALPPDRIPTDPTQEKSQLNLFLYQVTPNAGWRNAALPARNGRGERLTNPPLALDLHYLLTAYGEKELHAEILLGYGMQLLHETPVLTRDAIRRSLAPPEPLDAGSLPANLQGLYQAGLAEQVEQIKICPMSISTEEISRLWTAFQSHYRPTAAYQATVVLIESRSEAGRAALPVRERNVYAVPLAGPVIESLASQANDAAPILEGQAILAGYNLVIRGRQLRGADTRVNVDGIEVVPAPAQVTGERIILPLPGALRAGVRGVQVVHYLPLGTPETPHRGFSSNVSAFVLRPFVQAVSATTHAGSGAGLLSGTISLQVTPAIGRDQRVVLLLNEFDAPAGTPNAYSIPVDSPYQVFVPPQVPPETATSVAVNFKDVRAGKYLVRVQVDGAESPLASDAAHQYNSPLVEIV